MCDALRIPTCVCCPTRNLLFLVLVLGVGAFTPPDKVNLGEPVWDDSTDDVYDNNGDPKNATDDDVK